MRNKILKSVNVTLQQKGLYAIIDTQPEITAQELVDYSKESYATVIKVLRSLVDSNLVVKHKTGKHTVTYSPNKTFKTNSTQPLFQVDKELKKLTKQEIWLDHVTKKFATQDFSLQVKGRLIDYFTHLAETNTLHGDKTMQSQIDSLRKLKQTEQLKVLDQTIDSGWKSVRYAIEQLSRNQGSLQSGTKNESEFKDGDYDSRVAETDGVEF